VSNTTSERIVELLRTETRATVVAALAEVEATPVTTFVTLLLKEEEQQEGDRPRNTDNVVDDNQCRR